MIGLRVRWSLLDRDGLEYLGDKGSASNCCRDIQDLLKIKYLKTDRRSVSDMAVGSFPTHLVA